MGNGGAKASGMEAAPVTVKDSIDGMLSKASTYLLLKIPATNCDSVRLTVQRKRKRLEHFSHLMRLSLHGNCCLSQTIAWTALTISGI